jgi:hypothetical protein
MEPSLRHTATLIRCHRRVSCLCLVAHLPKKIHECCAVNSRHLCCLCALLCYLLDHIERITQQSTFVAKLFGELFIGHETAGLRQCTSGSACKLLIIRVHFPGRNWTVS